MKKSTKLLKKLKKIKFSKKIVLGTSVALVLLMGLFVISGKNNEKAIAAGEQVGILAENIQKFYRNRPDAWGLNTETVINKRLLPENMSKREEILVNLLDKKTTIGSDKIGNMVMPGNRSFKIAYWDLNREECIEISSQEINEKMQLSLSEITIINEKTSVFSWGGEKSLPISRATAKGICSQKNTIIWNVLL